jgi:glycine dehydrogenase
MYVVYHGAEGLKNIAKRVSTLANTLSKSLAAIGFINTNTSFFDTLCITCDAKNIIALAQKT